MTEQLSIRKASPEDLGSIAELWKELMDFHGERDGHFWRSADGHEGYKEFLAGHLSSDRSCVLVAERGGAIVGYCLATLAKYPPVFKKRDYGTVFDLAVTERYRRSGVGQRLYEGAQSWFAGQEVHRIEVRVAVTNEVSTAFWRKMGFKPYIQTVFKRICQDISTGQYPDTHR
jgi:ribosomal protein S18 acetylase RimI-like enzyme